MRVDRIFVYAFLFALALPVLGRMTGVSSPIQSSEFHPMAPFPTLDSHPLDELPRAFEAYYRDDFGFRGTLFRIYSAIKYFVFSVSPLPDEIYLGKEGYFFYRDPRFSKLVTGKLDFSKQELEGISESILRNQKRLSDLGIHFYVAIVPGKHSICSHLLPGYLESETPGSRMKKFIAFLREKGVEHVLNLGDGFPDENPCSLYRPTDPHWNELGAFFGARHLMEEIQKDLGDVLVPKLEDFEILTKEIRSGAFARMMNLPIKEEYIALERKGEVPYLETQKKSKIPAGFGFRPSRFESRYNNRDTSSFGSKALLVHDSFGDYMKPMINPGFRETVYFWRDEQVDWWDEALILEEKPDVVVLEITESKLELLQEQSFSKN